MPWSTSCCRRRAISCPTASPTSKPPWRNWRRRSPPSLPRFNPRSVRRRIPNPDSGDPAVRNFWLTGQIQGAVAAGQFDRARQLLHRARRPAGARPDQRPHHLQRSRARHREQERPGAEPGESVEARDQTQHALHRHDRRQHKAATSLSAWSPWPPRTSHRSPRSRGFACSPRWQRASLRVDTETSFGVLNQLVAAYNDVRANPRRGKFDPAKVRRATCRQFADPARQSRIL